MILGIDLGTTNSSMAYVDGAGGREVQNVVVAPRAETPYDSLLRSTVYLDKRGEPAEVGEPQAAEAWRRAQAANHEGVLLDSFKPYLNLRFLRKNDSRIGSREVGGDYSRKEIITASAAVLDRMFKAYLKKGGTPEQIYVGIPFGYWDFAKRRFLQALVKSGIVTSFRDALSKVAFVYEPVAIAYTYKHQPFSAEYNVMVFDAGGGTIDLSVLRFKRTSRLASEPVEVVGLGALPVAGRHIDEILANGLATKYESVNQIRAYGDPLTRDRLQRAVEELKKKLSVQEAAKLEMEGLDETISLTRGGLEELLKGTIAQISQAVAETLKGAGLKANQISAVRMAGGTSLIPVVQSLMKKQLFSEEFTTVVAADPRDDKRNQGVEESLTAVSRGLAEFGARQQSRKHSFSNYRICSFSDQKLMPLMSAATPFGDDGWASGPQVTLDCGSEQSTSLVVFQDYQGDAVDEKQELIMRIIDVPVPTPKITVRCRLSKSGSFPVLEAWDAHGAQLDLPRIDKLTEERAKAYLESDDAALNAGGPANSPAHTLLPAKLRLGDTVEVTNALFSGGILRKAKVRGKIRVIRKISDASEFASAPWLWNKESGYKFDVFCDEGDQGHRTYRGIRFGPGDVVKHDPESRGVNVFTGRAMPSEGSRFELTGAYAYMNDPDTIK